jgi:flavin reductase (DIM6/NTAB) family NADH-FMN oxidoreductase RutF
VIDVDPEVPAFTPALHRSVLGLFATGVTVISTRAASIGEVRGMTANAFMSVSFDPALVVVGVRQGAHLHDLIRESRNYGVSLLSTGLEPEARRFAGMPVPADAATPRFVDRRGVPVLEHALGWLTAAVVDDHPAGDHTLFIGEICDLGVGQPGDRPLGYFRSSFAEITTIAGRSPLPIESWGDSINGIWG